jgi:hypothetical protein
LSKSFLLARLVNERTRDSSHISIAIHASGDNAASFDLFGHEINAE